MLSLYCSVRSLVVWGNEGDFYTEDSLQILPQTRLVRITIVAKDLIRTAIPGQPGSYEAITTIKGCCRWKGDTFQPPGPAAEDREDILHALRLREGSHDIGVDLAESPLRYRKLFCLWPNFNS